MDTVVDPRANPRRAKIGDRVRYLSALHGYEVTRVVLARARAGLYVGYVHADTALASEIEFLRFADRERLRLRRV